jgi:hypothetical protein
MGSVIGFGRPDTLITSPVSGSPSTLARQVYPLLSWRCGNTQTGAIVLTAPLALSSVIHQLEIVGDAHTSLGAIRLLVSGYRVSGAWTNTYKVNLGSLDLMARWGAAPDGRNCLILGDVDSTWTNVHLAVARAHFSNAPSGLDAYSVDWSVSVVTDLSGYTNVTAAIANSQIANLPVRLGGSSTGSIIADVSTGSPNVQGRFAYNLGFFWHNSSTSTGAIVFSAPTTATNILHELEFEGALNTTNADIIKLTAKGYRGGGAWSGTSCKNTGSVDVLVRWAVNPSGQQCVILGNVDTVWNAPTIALARAVFGGTGSGDTYCAPWSVAQVTDLSSYTQLTGYCSEYGTGPKRSAVCATTADVGASTFSAGVLTGYSASVALNVTTTSSSTTATTTDTSGIKVGATISGNANIPAATVASITDATTFVLSVAATGSGTASTTFTQTIAAFAADGITPARNERVLLKNQTSALQNGLYVLTTLGSASVPWVLTRAPDANISANLAGAIVTVEKGTVHGGQDWSTDYKSSATINSGAVNWYRLVDSRGVFDQAGAASTPGASLTGTWFSGGSATTTKPKFLVEPTGTTSTGWSTAGTGLGVNAPSGFTGRLLDLQLNGVTAFNVDSTGRASVPLGTVGLPSIYPGTDTNTGLWSPGADQIALSTNGTEALRVDGSQRTLHGATAARANFFNSTVSALLQVEGTGSGSGRFVSVTNNDNTSGNPAGLVIAKSRGTALGGTTVVQSGDWIGNLSFQGSDGTEFVAAAYIDAYVDGAPSANDMPGRLVFSTTLDGASSPTEALRITNDAVIAYNQPAPVAVNSTATLTIANLKAGIITSTSAAATDMTLPTGTLTEAGFSGVYTNFTFEWSVINTGPSLVRVLAGATHTVIGSGNVAAGTSARFATRRTASNTFVTYQIA